MKPLDSGVCRIFRHRPARRIAEAQGVVKPLDSGVCRIFPAVAPGWDREDIRPAPASPGFTPGYSLSPFQGCQGVAAKIERHTP